MPSIEVLLEGERRGLLDEGNKTLLAEARRRGLAPGGETGPAAPTMNFDLTEIPGRILTGLGNIPSAAYNMVAGPLSAYKTLSIGSEASQPKTLAEADKFYNQRAVAPRALGTAEGLASGAALGIPSRFLPETTNEDRLAARELGGAIGSTITGGAAFNKLSQLGYGAMAKFIGLPAAMSAAEPLSRLDIPGAVESATTGAGLGGVAKLAGSVASPLIERYGPAGRALRAQNEALGGGKGVLNAINKQVTESRVPDLAPESYTTPTSVAEAGATAHNQFKVAGNVARATMSDRLQNEVFKLAPEDAVAPNSYIEKFKTLATEGPEALRSTVQKKIGKLADEAVPKDEGVNSGWVKKAVQMWEGVDDNTLKQIKSVFNNTDAGQNPTTFKSLVELHQELGQIKGSDSAVRLVKLAKGAVEHDINELGKTYPDAVRAWRMWNKDYATTVGQYYNKGTPGRSLFEDNFGRPDVPFSEKIPKLVAMAPEEARSVMEGLRQGPAGAAAVDNVSAGAWQHLMEKHQTAYGTNWKAVVEDLSKPQQRRTWEEVLGPRFATAMKLKNALVDTGLSNYSGGDPRAVSMASNFHTMYGGAQAVGALTGIGGSPFSALYHLGSAAMMKIRPEIAARVLNDRMGAQLLAAGLLEKPGTLKANRIISKLAEVVDRVGPEPQGPAPAGAPISEATIMPSGPLALPPSSTPGIPPPGPGNRPIAPISPFPEYGVGSRGSAAESARAIQEAALAEKAYLQSDQARIDLLRSLRAQQGKGDRFADADRISRILHDRFSGANVFPPNLDEHAALVKYSQGENLPPILRDAVDSVLAKYPAPVQVQPELSAAPVEAPAPLTKLAVEPHSADAIRARQAEVAKAFQSKGPKTKENYTPIELMNNITGSGKNKLYVSPTDMSELKRAYKGTDFASKWFTDDIEQAQPGHDLDYAISKFSENYGITNDYNAWKDVLDNAYSKYQPEERMTQIRRKGNQRTKAEAAEYRRLVKEKQGKK